jgi:hypothetical protein
MSASILLAAAWVFAATGVAFLPLRFQMVPGLVLMAAAPFVIAYLGVQHGWVGAVAGAAGFVSMFRQPLRYFWARLRGRAQEPVE